LQVIAYLETGTGKTLIAVLLINYYIESVPRPLAEAGPSDATDLKRMVVCLVPTVILVAQQAGVFRRYSKHNVREYLGSKGIDEWDRQRWNKERRCDPQVESPVLQQLPEEMSLVDPPSVPANGTPLRCAPCRHELEIRGSISCLQRLFETLVTCWRQLGE
jgi:hypothetical protein